MNSWKSNFPETKKERRKINIKRIHQWKKDDECTWGKKREKSVNRKENGKKKSGSDDDNEWNRNVDEVFIFPFVCRILNSKKKKRKKSSHEFSNFCDFVQVSVNVRMSPTSVDRRENRNSSSVNNLWFVHTSRG